MKLTIEQIRAWTLEAAREPGFDPIENIEDELAGIPDAELMAALFICTKAAAWAREQALTEAANVCKSRAADHPSVIRENEADDCATAILALKDAGHD